MKRLFLILMSFVLAAFVSCSRVEPRILFGFMEKTYFWEDDGLQKQYSFFILSEDDDGIENLAELQLFHDREGLRWLFTADDWVLFEDGGRNWIGSRNIAMHDGANLPRGQFRAVLINKGGERTERLFSFDVPEDSPHPFPAFLIDDGLFRLDSAYPVNRLLVYNEQGDVIQTVPLVQEAGNFSDLNLSGNAIGVSLWAEDPLYRISALTEVAALR